MTPRDEGNNEPKTAENNTQHFCLGVVMSRVISFKVSLVALLFVMMSLPIHAAAEKVDLELALGADVSGSVDDEEAALQRQGYIQAFRHPSVFRAILSGIIERLPLGITNGLDTDIIRLLLTGPSLIALKLRLCSPVN